MRRDLFSEGDAVLLLGEGNFSFSIGLLNLKLPITITSSCFESSLTAAQAESKNVLEASDVRVLTAIDATKVHEHHVLKNEKFNKIVFNFPHVGGKMKIHLNRALLEHFFHSASQVLVQPGGFIIVSLCRGQGADYADKRCWGDSWQIVEMAGKANLFLFECSPFIWELFPSYSNVGYRSQEKGFWSDGAVVHVLKHVEPYYKWDMDVKHVSHMADSDLQLVYASKMKRGISSNSPACFIIKELKAALDPNLNCQCVADEQSYFSKTGRLRSSLLENISGIMANWRGRDTEILMSSGLVFNKLSDDFQQAPVSIQTLLISRLGKVKILEVLERLSKRFNCSKSNLTEITITESVVTESNIPLKQILFTSDTNSYQLVGEVFLFSENLSVTLLNIDTLIMQLLRLASWKQFWAEGAVISCIDTCPFIQGICPFPIEYSFDISFFFSKEFSEGKMLNILWDVGGDFINKVELVSEIVGSKCYRISYMSYERPMCREMVLFIHANVIGGALAHKLGVTIR